MGKNKKSGVVEEVKSTAFVLKVAMHCSCHGCIDKIRAAAKDITRLQGVETWDQSALETKGELKLVATADPDRLRQRLHKATRKQVDLLFPANKDKDKAAAATAAPALLLDSVVGLQQQGGQWQYGHPNAAAWASQPLAGGWSAHMGYPWAAAYPPPAALLQGYGGAWHGGHGGY
jgi:hypothetical protein